MVVSHTPGPNELMLLFADILVRLSLLYPPIRPEPESADANKGSSEAAARHLAKYVFPRQFGLHNVFTNPKPRVSVDVLPDYVDREFEIKVRLAFPADQPVSSFPSTHVEVLQRLGTTKTPPRLKAAIPLLQKMKVLSSRCNMRKILDKRCPSRVRVYVVRCSIVSYKLTLFVHS